MLTIADVGASSIGIQIIRGAVNVCRNVVEISEFRRRYAKKIWKDGKCILERLRPR